MGLDLTGVGSIADFATSVVERILPPKASEAERNQARLAMQELLQKRETQVVDAQRSVIVAELQQGDNFTKRARPGVVYAGLLFIFLVNVLFPIISWFTKESMPKLQLPSEFWWAWTGVVSVWMVGRTMEKRGSASKVAGLITGSKSLDVFKR